MPSTVCFLMNAFRYSIKKKAKFFGATFFQERLQKPSINKNTRLLCAFLVQGGDFVGGTCGNELTVVEQNRLIADTFYLFD